MKTLSDITYTPRDRVILIGCGPSVDTLNLTEVNQQSGYDTCVLSDAIKIIEHPTYAINYHYQGLRRIKDYIDNPRHMIFPYGIVQHEVEKRERKKQPINYDVYDGYQEKLDNLDNLYYFHSSNMESHKQSLITSKEVFQTYRKDVLYHVYGSIVGALHFLLEYMQYKHISYIGFDGGMEYGKRVHHGRKPNKKHHAAVSYANSWNEAMKIVSWYDNISFQPLQEFVYET